MAKIKTSGRIDPALGKQKLQLTSCTLKQMENTFAKDLGPNGEKPMVNKLVWVFVSNKLNSQGDPGEYVVITGDLYGDARSGLTQLLNMIEEDMSEEKVPDIDTDNYVGRWYDTSLIAVVDPKTKASRVKHAFLTECDPPAPPRRGKAAPPPVVEEEDEEEEDVFDE